MLFFIWLIRNGRLKPQKKSLEQKLKKKKIQVFFIMLYIKLRYTLPLPPYDMYYSTPFFLIIPPYFFMFNRISLLFYNYYMHY